MKKQIHGGKYAGIRVESQDESGIAHFTHREHLDRSIVNTQIGHRERKRSDAGSPLGFELLLLSL